MQSPAIAITEPELAANTEDSTCLSQGNSIGLIDLQELIFGFHMAGAEATTYEEAKETLGALSRLATGMKWTDIADQAHRLLDHVELGKLKPDALEALAEDLKTAYENKTKKLRIALIEERDASLYCAEAQTLCGGALNGDLSIAEEELNLAGRALAFGLSTAAVAHAMRSAEASLHALCRVLGITFLGTVELQDWKVLTDKAKKKIGELEQQARSQQKSDELKQLSELMIPADGFRLAWHNHVAHAREKYETEEARTILTHVGEFLRRLSAAL